MKVRMLAPVYAFVLGTLQDALISLPRCENRVLFNERNTHGLDHIDGPSVPSGRVQPCYVGMFAIFHRILLSLRTVKLCRRTSDASLVQDPPAGETAERCHGSLNADAQGLGDQDFGVS